MKYLILKAMFLNDADEVVGIEYCRQGQHINHDMDFGDGEPSSLLGMIFGTAVHSVPRVIIECDVQEIEEGESPRPFEDGPVVGKMTINKYVCTGDTICFPTLKVMKL